MTYRIDLHIHSARYSVCAQTLDPEAIAARLAARGLDGGVIAEHDHLWSIEELLVLQSLALNKAQLYRGVEISSAEGHILAIGLEELHDVPPGVSLARLTAVAEEQAAALIWVHPFLGYRGLRAPVADPRFGQGIHAMEIASTVTRGELADRAAALARLKHWTMVGGSDAHALINIGAAATEFPFLPENERQLARAIIDGHCRLAPD